MNILFVNPNLLVQENDPFTTGIIYMPMGLAYAAAAARSQGHQVTVIDAFAQKPKQVRKRGAFYYFGLTEDEITDQIPTDSDLVVVYAINLTNHNSTVSIIQTIKHKFPEISVAVLENSQAVTAYSLHSSAVLTVFQKAGADYFLINDGDYKLLNLIKAIEDHDVINLEAYCLVKKQAKTETIANLDALPFPAWDLFPLENYWGLRFAHGPVASQKYLPLLTSRGCPYPCRFCVVPTTNNQKWRARSAKNVVDEIEYWQKTYGVNEFHWEDLDPTVSDKRTGEICEEIINRGLNISWKLVSGTKVETMKSEATISKMAKAGCKYISISPETGSARLLKAMNKPFDLTHAVKIVGQMQKVGIKSQACFVLGYPTETQDDRQLTWNLVKDLTRKGIDEIALFIITPVPGSAIYEEFKGFSSLSQLNFSPTWRKDYVQLSRFRLTLYKKFLLWKIGYHPFKVIKQSLNFVLRRFETKMEMVPYRALMLKWWMKFCIKDEQTVVSPQQKRLVVTKP